jgi:hypothetical protein
MSRYIVNAMYLEKPKHLIIWNEVTGTNVHMDPQDPGLILNVVHAPGCPFF